MAGTFTKNTIITSSTEFLILILGIIPSVMLARILGPEGKGIYALSLLVPSFLYIFIEFGVGGAIVYYSAKKQYSLKEILGSNIIISIFVSIIALMIGLIIILFLREKIVPSVKIEYLLLALLIIPSQIFLAYVANILWGLQKIKEYNLINLVRTIIFALLIFIFLLVLRFGIMAAISASILTGLINCLMIFLKTKKETAGVTWKINKPYLRDVSSYGFKTYLGNILGITLSRVDVFMINIFLNPMAVGFYSVAVGLAEQLWLISRPAGRVLFPRVSSEADPKQLKEFTPLVFRTSVFITLITAILLFLLSRWVVILLYSEMFLDSISSFKILLIGVVAISGSGILINDLYGRGKPMVNTYTTAIAVVLNIILNILWIPKFGIIGAAWATSISYTAGLIVITIIYSKISGNKIKDIIFIKKSDLKIYKQLIFLFLRKLKIKWFFLKHKFID